MSKKSKFYESLVMRKTLVLATAFSLSAFGFTGIGTGAALGEPTSNTESPTSTSVKIIKLANGKTRVKVDLADNLRGKSIVIKTTRMVNGKRVKVTLGKIKLNKTGKGKLTVSRKIRVDDRLVLSDGNVNILRSRVSVIDDSRITSVPAPPSSGGSSVVATTFTVTVSDEAGAQPIAFGGTASGDVTVTMPGGGSLVVFTRGGVEASTKLDANGANFGDIIIPNPGINSLVMSTDVFFALPFGPNPNVKIAGAVDAASLIMVSQNLGSQLDATLVTAITGMAADVDVLSVLGSPDLQNEIQIVFGNTALTLTDTFDQTKRTDWMGTDGATFVMGSEGETLVSRPDGTWAFDSTLGVVKLWEWNTVSYGLLISGLGTIVSVSGFDPADL